jgi:hypothetical protein
MAANNLLPGAGFVDDSSALSNLVPGVGLLSGASAGAISLTVNNATHAHTAGETALTIPSTDTITLTDLTNRRVYQRSGTSKTITVTGSYTYASTPPTYIQARVVQDGTSTEVQTWTTLGSATIAGGNFSGTLSVPQGGWYNIQVRFNNSATVSNGTNKFGVGILVLCVGQSNMDNWFTTGTVTSNALAVKHSGAGYPSTQGTWAAATSTGAGYNTFANALITAYSVPVGMLKYTAGGTQISQWDGSGDAYPRDAITAATQCGGAIEYILWSQGEADASAGTSQATYETGLTNCIANFRAQISNGSGETNLPFLLTILGRGTAGSLGSDAQVEAIRAAQRAVAGAVADVYIACTALDLPIADEGGSNWAVHYTAAGYTTMAQRYVQTVKYLLGDETYYRGPYISSAVIVDATHTDVNITHRGGANFTPDTAIGGFEIDDSGGGGVLSPSAAVQYWSNVVRLTHVALTGTPTLRYGYGLDGGQTHASAFTNPVLDTSDAALPLEQINGLDILEFATLTADLDATESGSDTFSGTGSWTAVPTAGVSVTITLVDRNNSTQVNLSALRWAWFDESSPELFSAPVEQGVAEVTNSSGVLTIGLPNTTLSSGQTGWLVLSDGNYPGHKAFCGQVVVE